MSIGEDLAQARGHAGLTVAQVSQRTRIRQTIIRGIESDDYSVCGGDFYARGHIRSIAKVVGADPEPLIHEYDTAHRAPSVMSATAIDELVALSPAAGRRRPDVTAGWRRPDVTARPPRLDAKRQWNWKPSWTVAAVGLALVLLTGLVGYHLVTGAGPAGTASGAAHIVPHRQAGHARVNRAPAARSVTTPAHRPATSPAAPAAVPVRGLAPVGATAFGVSGRGQGDNPQTARRAIDGRPATAWRSDWYTTARFGNLYPGTGLLLDMGHPVTITGMRISLGSAPGAALQIRVGAARGLAQLPPTARAAGAAGVLRLRFSRPAHGRYVLLWFTRLPADPAGTFQASVYNIELTGA